MNWKWSSYFKRAMGTTEQKKLLATTSVTWPTNYNQLMVQPEPELELLAIRNSIKRGTPYGGESWIGEMLQKFDLEVTTNKRGRPFKGT